MQVQVPKALGHSLLLFQATRRHLDGSGAARVRMRAYVKSNLLQEEELAIELSCWPLISLLELYMWNSKICFPYINLLKSKNKKNREKPTLLISSGINLYSAIPWKSPSLYICSWKQVIALVSFHQQSNYFFHSWKISFRKSMVCYFWCNPLENSYKITYF